MGYFPLGGHPEERYLYAHTCKIFDSNCFRCDLNLDELPRELVQVDSVASADRPYYKLRVVPYTLAKSNAYVKALHRHHTTTVGCKFCLQVQRLEGPEWVMCGVVIVGRPVSRVLDDGFQAEVNRLCTDGTRNACSALYAASRRVWRAMGGTRIITYILASEPGTSLKGAGWQIVKSTPDRPIGWHTPSRPRVSGPQVPKQLWESLLSMSPQASASL